MNTNHKSQRRRKQIFLTLELTLTILADILYPGLGLVVNLAIFAWCFLAQDE
ncbi:MAG: hypothetical protein F6J86_17640 [Symploca sp. SIO1B1]|nr:hypothetical protein [Symploca sp. SIO1A3]NER95633.1 hypothetical protein [Symploca sp. SIO1B1]